jgi:GrpB-like predicted nucleotidyltransferase (UPF0157 family)
VTVAPYDRAWPARSEEERLLLQQALGGFVTGGIHHVGSTAVPGLDAKPVIDILAGVGNLASARPFISLVAPLGYRYAPYRADEMHWFCKPHPSRRTHHLHLVPAASARYRDELRFRDYLREHPQARVDYAALKRDLATRLASDREAYTDAKTGFVRDVLRRAAGDCQFRTRPDLRLLDERKFCGVALAVIITWGRPAEAHYDDDGGLSHEQGDRVGDHQRHDSGNCPVGDPQQESGEQDREIAHRHVLRTVRTQHAADLQERRE